MDIQQLPSSSSRRWLRTFAVLGVIGSSIGVGAGAASAAPAPQNTLCQLLSDCDEDGDDTEPGDEPEIDLGIVEIDLDIEPPPDTEPAGPLGDLGGLADLEATVMVTDDVLVQSTDDGFSITHVGDADVRAGDLDVDLHQDVVATIGTEDGLIANVDADNSTRANAGDLTVVDNDAAVCGVQVVVTGSGHRTCDMSGVTLGSGDDALLDVDAAESICGVHVGVLGDSSVDCDPDGTAGGQNSGSTDLLDGDVFAALCGIEVAIIGSTSTNCGDTPTTDIAACLGIAPLCDSLVDIDGTLGLCGLGISVIGTTDTDCGDDDDDGDDHSEDSDDTDTDDDGDDDTDDDDDSDDGDDDNTDDDGDDDSDDGDDDNTDSGAPGDDDDQTATDSGTNSFASGGSAPGSNGLPLTGGSVALTLLIGAALSLTGFGLRRGSLRA